MTLVFLPNHSSLTSQDPLGICSDDEGTVNHGKLLAELINIANNDLARLEKVDETLSQKTEQHGKDVAWIERLERLLQDIAYSLHGNHCLNTQGLREVQIGHDNPSNWRRNFRQTLFYSALQLDALFPSGILPPLNYLHQAASFSSLQVDALLAHMFLGTLQTPVGNTWGRPSFSECYAGDMISVAPNTALAYLRTIVSHFALQGYAAYMGPEQRFTFSFTHAAIVPALAACEQQVPRLPVTLVEEASEPSAKSDAFVLVAANAQPGPGAGGTHEERLVGQSPALALVCLLTPVLDAGAAVVTSPLPLHSSWRGHGRQAQLVHMFSSDQRPSRRYIIADALPLDLSHRHANLLPGNVERETRKLYAAFSGASHAWTQDGKSLNDMRIEMPPWGCGAFGGSLAIKMPCMIMAAGLAGLKAANLELLVPREREGDVWQGMDTQQTVADVFNGLRRQSEKE